VANRPRDLWQQDSKTSPAAHSASDRNATSMLPDNILAYRQTQSGAFAKILARKERLENVVQPVVRNPNPGVTHFYLEKSFGPVLFLILRSLAADLYRNQARFTDRIQRIIEKVQEESLQ